MNQIEIVEANLNLTIHSQAVLDLLNGYACDPMGNGAPLSSDVLKNLIPGLQHHPTTIIFLAFITGQPIGVLTCFKGFSTFNARPLINISDFFVLPEHQGKGAGRLLLAAADNKALDLSCCKITLEVQENNHSAKALYAKAGYCRDLHVPEAGPALFYSKQISPVPKNDL